MSNELNRTCFGRKYIVEAITANDQLFSKSFDTFEDAMSQVEYWISIGCEINLYNYVFSMKPTEV